MGSGNGLLAHKNLGTKLMVIDIINNTRVIYKKYPVFLETL